jgi:hypothetical protein
MKSVAPQVCAFLLLFSSVPALEIQTASKSELVRMKDPISGE